MPLYFIALRFTHHSMATLRQQLLIQRTHIGVLATLCLLFHLLLPSIVNLGLMPKLLYMPTHCPSSVEQQQQATNMMSMHHIHHMHHHPVHHTQQITSLLFSGSEVQHIIDQAQQLMKHCPLCSHGLEGAVLTPLLVCLLLLILRWFVPIWRSFCGYDEPLYLLRVDYTWPYKQGPPFTL